jgi:hypothetical protein
VVQRFGFERRLRRSPCEHPGVQGELPRLHRIERAATSSFVEQRPNNLLFALVRCYR